MSVKMIFGKGRFWSLSWIQFFGVLNDNFSKTHWFLIIFQGGGHEESYSKITEFMPEQIRCVHREK